MYEKVNPCHPDKVADRIAGAIVDMAYAKQNNPRIAVEVLIGHNECTIIIESSVRLTNTHITDCVRRISGYDPKCHIIQVPQDKHLADNQARQIRCGDNGIFKGTPVTGEQWSLTKIAKGLFDEYPTDGKFILADDRLVICQSNVETNKFRRLFDETTIVNPLGDWTGGIEVDSGATNRKLGSDMGDGVTGGGLHGKDLSKADVSVNIWCYLQAQRLGHEVTAWCSIGDEWVNTSEGLFPYEVIVNDARDYIRNIGGFEHFAEWGLIR